MKVRPLTLLFLVLAGCQPGSLPHERAAIRLNSLTIDPRLPLPPPVLRAAPGDAHVLVKFPGPVTAAELAELRAHTEAIYTYLPDDTFLVRAKGDGALMGFGANFVTPYRPEYKISRAVRDLAPSTTLSAAAPLIVSVQLFPDADLEAVATQLAALGAHIVGQGHNRLFSRLRLLLTPDELTRLRAPIAQLPEVFWIDVEGRRRLLNDTTIWVGQSGLGSSHATPLFDHGLYGQGQIVGVIDTGIDADMCYFRDEARGLPPHNDCDGGTKVDLEQRKVIAVDFIWPDECQGGISSGEWDPQDHGTHVAGTIAGDNFANPIKHDPGDGMAPGAKLVMQACGYQSNSCADCPGIGCPVVDLNPLFQQTYDQGARLHSNSWGDNEDAMVQNHYSTASQDVDQFMWEHKDFQLFFAAGNAGPGTAKVGSPSTAKSVLSIGATQHASQANSIANFSSCGPTDDGRVKPDLTVPGADIISAANDKNINSKNCNTRSMSGTSMATPGAAGLAALTRQYFMEGWYPTGQKVAANAFVPTSALLRATLISSAESMTNAGPIPDNCQGWGRITLDDALYFAGDSRGLWLRDETNGIGAAGDARSYPLTVGAAAPLKVTLTWTDYPSTPAAMPHLNNDLDLSVKAPDGTEYLGNVLKSGYSQSGGKPDRLNTVEEVLIKEPMAGDYVVTVKGFNIPNGPQPFAVVVTGAELKGDVPDMGPGPGPSDMGTPTDMASARDAALPAADAAQPPSPEPPSQGGCSAAPGAPAAPLPALLFFLALCALRAARRG